MCWHCQDRWSIGLPADLDVVTAAGKAYLAKHRRCPPKEGP